MRLFVKSVFFCCLGHSPGEQGPWRRRKRHPEIDGHRLGVATGSVPSFRRVCAPLIATVCRRLKEVNALLSIIHFLDVSEWIIGINGKTLSRSLSHCKLICSEFIASPLSSFWLMMPPLWMSKTHCWSARGIFFGIHTRYFGEVCLEHDPEEDESTFVFYWTGTVAGNAPKDKSSPFEGGIWLTPSAHKVCYCINHLCQIPVLVLWPRFTAGKKKMLITRSGDLQVLACNISVHIS